MDFEELICGVCQQPFDNDQHLPRMVPRCGHTFCTQCISDIINATSNTSEHLFCCPDDRIIIRLRNSDVACFPINFLLASLVGKKAHLTNNKVPKSATKEDYPPIDKRRNSSFGLSTTGSHADGNGDLSLHSTKNNLFAVDNGTGDYCLEHGKVLEVVCIDDKCRVCSSCALFGSHKNHEIRPEGEVLKEVANRAESIIDLFQTIQKQEKSILEDQNIKDIQKKLNERHSELTRLIQDKFMEFINMLKGQERYLLEELDNKFNYFREKISKKSYVSQDVIGRVKTWKTNAEEALTIMSEKSEKGDIAYELLEDRRNIKNDIVFLGEKLTYELKKIKETTSRSYEGDEMNISVTFNENFSKILDLLCQVIYPSSFAQKLVSDTSLDEIVENSSFQKLPAFGKTEKSLNNSRNNIKTSVPEINIFKRTTEGQEEKFIRNKENNIHVQDPRLVSPTANFGTSLDQRRSEHDTDLLDFELNDLNIAELAESDHIAQFAQPEIKGLENNETDRFRIFRKKDWDNEDYETPEALNNLTNRSTSSRPATERKSKQPCSRKDEEAYVSLSRDTSRVIRRSVSPLKRDNSSDRLPKSSRARRNKELQVSEKYEPIVEGIMYNIVDSADLTGADLGDIGVCKLADFLRANTKLRSLKLLRNKITDEGGIALANALMHNRTLQTLNLTQNLVTEKTVDAFLELIKTHKSIKTLYFNQNSISLRNVRAKIKEMGAMGVSVNI